MPDAVAQQLLDFDRAMEEAARRKKMHQAAFRAAYDYLEAFYPPRDDEEYWYKVSESAGNIASKHKGNPLIVPIMLAMLKYLEDVWREKRGLK